MARHPWLALDIPACFHVPGHPLCSRLYQYGCPLGHQEPSWPIPGNPDRSNRRAEGKRFLVCATHSSTTTNLRESQGCPSRAHATSLTSPFTSLRREESAGQRRDAGPCSSRRGWPTPQPASPESPAGALLAWRSAAANVVSGAVFGAGGSQTSSREARSSYSCAFLRAAGPSHSPLS